MAGAMIVVQPRLPQRASREGVKMRPTDTMRKYQRGNGNVALQYPRRLLTQSRGRLARSSPECAGYISRAVDILGSRIDQVHLVRLNRSVTLVRNPVMYDRTMFAGTRDCRKALA